MSISIDDLILQEVINRQLVNLGMIAPKKVKITLAEYVEAIKKIVVDPWQLDLCNRLEKAFWLARAAHFEFTLIDCGKSGRFMVTPSGFLIEISEFEKNNGVGTKAAIHSMPQAGKSIIISQAYPCWILGYDPTHRYRLATYNQKHSKRFSGVIRRILNSPEHKAIFPDPAGFVPVRSSADEWYTAARSEVNDGQPSFIALGLESNFVGSGADTLTQDDPYASAQAALSENTRDVTWRFYTDTAVPRLREYSNSFIMFHRYHCLMPHVKIETPMGTTAIKDLRIGDSVLTSKGAQTVLDVGRRRHRGLIYKTRVFGYPLPLETSPDHRLFTEDGWREAQTLKPGDWMMFPIPAGETDIADLKYLIPASPRPRVRCKSRNTGERERVDRAEFTRMYQSGMTCKAIGEFYGGKTSQAMQRYVTLWGLNRTHANKLNADPLVDPKFWWFVGLWLAEGCINKKGLVRLTLNVKTEQWIVDEIETLFRRYSIAISRYNGPSAVQVQFSSLQIRSFLSNFGKGALHKFLPEWAVHLPTEHAQQMVRGYALGDGFISELGYMAGTVRIGSSSLELLEGFKRLLLRQKVCGSIMAREKASKRTVVGPTACNVSASFELRFSVFEAPWISETASRRRKISRTAYLKNGWLYVRIKAIEIEEYVGELWDITTPCHDFLACGMTVHNSQDQGGRAIATGEFELWRYAAQADGEYEDDETGLKFPCFPLDREEGEYLSTRYPEAYYRQLKKNDQVWQSQFQGRPTSKTGSMFDITMIKEIELADVPPILHRVRSWDNAATDEGGAYTAGALLGVDSEGNFYLFDMKREQVNTAKRKQLQRETADEDGKSVTITMPQDPGSAGKDVAFEAVDEFRKKGFDIKAEPVSGTKVLRATNFSEIVNFGRFYFVKGDWDLKGCKNEVRDFPTVGAYKDRVDCISDGVKYLLGLMREGLVVNGSDEVNVLDWDRFSEKFSYQIPETWEVSIACALETGAKPSGWAITARAAENANLDETVFIVASARKNYTSADQMLIEITTACKIYLAGGIEQVQTFWIAKGNDEAINLAMEKYDLVLQVFEDDAKAGLPETNWYFQPLKTENPFYAGNKANGRFHAASRAYILSEHSQIEEAKDERGQLSVRQDMKSWTFAENGEPQKWGGMAMNCVRMTLYQFSLNATALTKEERQVAKLPAELRPDAVTKLLGTDKFVETYWAQQHALGLIAEEEREDQRTNSSGRFAAPASHRRYHRN